MPGKVIDPNQNPKERNFGIVYVSNENDQDIPDGIYIYEKNKGNNMKEHGNPECLPPPESRWQRKQTDLGIKISIQAGIYRIKSSHPEQYPE